MSKHLDWLLNHKDFDGDECLQWPFATRSNGYGAAFHNGKYTSAHRAMCIEAHGAAPNGIIDATHLCGNRSCVNPKHLRWADRAQNQADRLAHGTDGRGERHYRSKLNEESVRCILAERPRGARVFEMAADLGVSDGAIYSVLTGKNWKHIRKDG